MVKEFLVELLYKGTPGTHSLVSIQASHFIPQKFMLCRTVSWFNFQYSVRLKIAPFFHKVSDICSFYYIVVWTNINTDLCNVSERFNDLWSNVVMFSKMWFFLLFYE